MNALELHRSLTTHYQATKLLQTLPTGSNVNNIVKVAVEAFIGESIPSTEGVKEVLQNALTNTMNALKGKKYFEDIRKSDYLKSLKSDEFSKLTKSLKVLAKTDSNTFENGLLDAFLSEEKLLPYLFTKEGKLIDIQKQYQQSFNFVDRLYKNVEELAKRVLKEEVAINEHNLLHESGVTFIQPDIVNLDYDITDQGIKLDLVKPKTPNTLSINEVVNYLNQLKPIVVDLERKLGYLDNQLNNLFTLSKQLPTNEQAVINSYIQSILYISRTVITNLLLGYATFLRGLKLSPMYIQNITLENIEDSKERSLKDKVFEFLNIFSDGFLKGCLIYFVTLAKWWVIVYFTAMILSVSLPVAPIALGGTIFELYTRYFKERLKELMGV